MLICYDKLWDLLINKKLSKQDLYDLAGIKLGQISLFENAESLSKDDLSRVCFALECNMEDITISNKNVSNTHADTDEITSSKSTRQELKIISLFSGAGGLDIGFEKAGFTIAVALEADPACCETLRVNRPSLPIINDRIENVTSNDILSRAKLFPLEAALVIGGPPCQSFSLAGSRKGLDDERGKLLFEYVRIVRETLPIGFVLENVKGLGNWDSGRALELLINELSKPIEYNGQVYSYTIARPQIMNAVDYGVPQYRERIIVAGNRKGLSFVYPKRQRTQSPTTVWSAIGDLPKPDAPSETAVRVSNTIKARREKHGY